MADTSREVGTPEVEEVLRALRHPKAAQPGEATLVVAAIALLLPAVMQEDVVVEAEEVGVEVVRNRSSMLEPRSGWTAGYRTPMPSWPRSVALE